MRAETKTEPTSKEGNKDLLLAMFFTAEGFKLKMTLPLH